jgi:curved DNA-binding protein
VRDLYEALGVAKTASQDEIKRAYRDLTRKYHPDKNPDDASAEERFKEVSAAYDALGDPERRKLYDEFGEVSLTQGFDAKRARAYQQARQGFGGAGGYGFPGGFHFSTHGDARETSFDDLLSRLFGGGRIQDADDLFGHLGRQQRTRRGADLRGEISVTFMDALQGVTVPLRVDSASGEHRTLDVKVPQGICDGDSLRLRGQGGQGDPAGDILLKVRVKPHASLKRDGQNLLLDLPVTALEAYRGGPIDVPTPWGTVILKLPPGSQNGQTLRLRGKGVRAPRKPDGDLLVTLDVRLPAPGDERLLEALEALQADEDVRAGKRM